MKLLFIVKSLSTSGGAERVLATIASGLAQRGHEVALASFERDSDQDFYATDAAVERIKLSIGDSQQKARVGETISRMRLLRQLSNSMRPDVAIGFMHSAYIPLSLAVAGLRLPVVGSEHIVFDHYKARPKEAFLLRATHRLLSALTVTSEPVRSSFPAAVRKQMTVIRNPVVIPDQAGADVIGRPDRRKRLLSVGRLDQQKDFATLIEAFARIAPAVHDWDLRIIGEGALRPSLERQIKEAGLGGRISLPGATADIAREYASAQLFVLPSRYESFGLVTAEALACGLPAIGFRDCPGTNEMILHGRNGLLVAGEDRAAALADGLHELMMSPDMRQQLGAEGPASVAQFSPDVAIAKWEQFLTRVKSRENLG